MIKNGVCLDTLFLKLEGFEKNLWILTFCFYEVKGIDAHVLLSDCDGCGGIKMVLGGWNNEKSAIFEKKREYSRMTQAEVSEKTNFIANRL